MVRGIYVLAGVSFAGVQERKVKGSTVLRIHEMTVIEDPELNTIGR
jgi:hypothetical protein